VGSSEIYARGYRRSELHRLVIRALAFRENRSVQEIDERLRSGQLLVPAEVGFILGLDDRRFQSHISIGYIERLKYRLRWILGRFVTPTYSPDPRIEKVAEYLESFMEVDDDA
jgi:hypothetical protein